MGVEPAPVAEPNGRPVEPFDAEPALWRTVFDSFPEAVALVRAVRDEHGVVVDFRYEYVNEAGEQLMSVTAAGVFGSTISDRLGASRGAQVVAEFARLFEVERVARFLMLARNRATEIIGKRSGEHVIAISRDATESWRSAQAESQLRSALAQTDDIVTVLDAVRDESGQIIDLVYRHANPYAARLLRRSVADLIDSSLHDVVPGHPQWLFDQYVSVIETGIPVTADLPISMGRWSGVLHIVATRYRDGLLIVARDTTEQNTAREALERSEARFRSTVQALVEALFIWSSVRDDSGEIIDFRYDFVNAAAEQLIQTPSDQVIGRRLLEVFPAHVELGIWTRYRAVAETGIPDVIEIPWFDENGVAGSFEVSAVRHGDGVVAIARNITDRLRQERALEESEQRYRMLADNAGDVVFFGRDGIVQWVAPSIEHLLGIHPSQVIGTDAALLVHPDDRYIVRGLRARFVNPEQVSYRSRLVRADGSTVWVEARVKPVPDADGQFRGSVISTILNVQAEVEAQQALARAESERREQELRLAQASRLESLGVMAGGIAHDFNNLLVGVLGNAELALLGLPADSPVRPRMERVLSAAQHAADLTRQLLDYAGRRPRLNEAVGVRSLLVEARELVSSMLPASTMLLVSPDVADMVVVGDRSQLHQVLVNLVVNASDAMAGKPGNVVVRATRTDVSANAALRIAPDGGMAVGPHVLIEVIDDGPGMSAETRQRIFEPFFTTRPTGRGLGLAVVHGIVRSHGGAVLVTSEMGKGTTMAVHLPLGEPPAARVEVAENADHPGGEAPVVLVVDDDDDVREVSRLVLERSGMVVVTADGGPNALVEFGQRSGRFDAVLLDLTMPGMPGDAVLAQIREIDPTVPVVLISGYSDLDLQERLRELLVNGFVKKPFRAETLVSTVQRALRNTTG